MMSPGYEAMEIVFGILVTLGTGVAVYFVRKRVKGKLD